MRLEQLILENFRNYGHLEIEFSECVNCFIGENGAGKTSLIEAIHYLSLTRSFIHNSDMLAIREGASGFLIRGMFSFDSGTHGVACRYQRGSKKEIVEDGKAVSTFGSHIGKYPLVVISPLDGELITAGADGRRRFIDSTLSQLNSTYLQHLIAYHQTLRQRNAFLRSHDDGQLPDSDLVDAYDRELHEHGGILTRAREAFAAQLGPMVSAHYAHLHKQNDEVASISYLQDSTEDLISILRQNLSRDRQLGYTTRGPHRDDYTFKLNSHELRKRGSQGQQKTYVVALKLAQQGMLIQTKGFAPVLLIDDIFDKLDETRSRCLFEFIGAHQPAQVFMTDSNMDRVRNFLHQTDMEARLFHVKDGRLK